ncbi:HGxxPAAW family protein [Aeromicrobium sp.]|uniref:HGxxPAAW family protein n=1 Tax=Aeromicrobium sp. TaxID=1871063 RepID=UPI003C571C8C
MHGSSPAAWTAVLLCLLGITIAGVALIPNPHWVWFTVGCVVTLASGVVGRVMSSAGLGADTPEHSQQSQH